MGPAPGARARMSFGIVAIGRNEGHRLRECLASALSARCPVVYVDSASADGSAGMARSCGVDVVELDAFSAPLSAARARNCGFERLLETHSGLRFVQFLDADCVLQAGWLEAAARALEADPGRGAVLGHVLERNAAASAYNRLCALEWRSAPGDLEDYGRLGGISMMRAEVFRALGGFRAEVIAGEDSELGVRMALAGYKVCKIDRAMATHDAGMTRFGQWWRRAVRAGHAIGQRFELNGRSPLRDCARERASTVFWGCALPLAVLAGAVPTGGASLALLAAYPVLALRVWERRRRMGDARGEALLYAVFVVIAKFANAAGLIRFYLNKSANRYRIIEYK